MGLALDEPAADDEKIEVEGLSFITAREVADVIRSHGSLSIDYVRGLFGKRLELSLAGSSGC